MRPASTASSAAPPYAVLVWSDGLDLFAEIPGSPPYVMRLSLTDGGLHKALNLLKVRHEQARAGRYKPPAVSVTRKGKHVASPSQQQAALDVLRKMGFL